MCQDLFVKYILLSNINKHTVFEVLLLLILLPQFSYE